MADASRARRRRSGARSAPRDAASRLRPFARRLAAFVTERHPLALDRAAAAFDEAVAERALPDDPAEAIEALRPRLRRSLQRVLATRVPRGTPEPTPRVGAAARLRGAIATVVDDVDGFCEREAITASLDGDEKRELLRGMLLTRATDNQLKAFFLGGQVRYGRAAFQGKGFRSLGQEAIYAAPLRLRRGERWIDEDGGWQGDVVAPLIRDLGAALAMHPTPEAVRGVLAAQMGKAGSPMEGTDLHIGDLARGVLPASAPLSIPTATVAGLAMGFAQQATSRVAVSFIGEGGTSLGEWHEAINACAARRLPAIFCVQNNQTALSTPVPDQSSVRVFAEKAAGYGVPAVTIDGTDPEAIAAAFAWAARRARDGEGPTLIELVAMRMCGHAHHDDMLYLGHEPAIGWEYAEPDERGYVDRDAWNWWAARDPIVTYGARLERDGVIEPGDTARWRDEADALVAEQAQAVVDAPWPEPESVRPVVSGADVARHVEPLDAPRRRGVASALPPLDPGPAHDPKGVTFLEAVMRGVGDALEGDERVFLYGQDVGGRYGNAFLMLRPLLERFGDRILNAPLAEGAILGVSIGAALAGRRPIAEIQFNDFVATGFNQLVNNAAKIRYRWGGEVPMVVRMPWGGLRHAGPYHSQNTEPWFYRTPGLKIVVPSTPHDARALMAAAVADPDPVLYYEHIALYRDPRVKQALDESAPAPLELGRAALRRAGDDLTIVSYGAYVHVAQRVAATLADEGVEAAVLDLRTLAPLDREALLATARHTGKVLIVHEDSRTGGIGESLAAIVQEEAFEDLDAPVRVVGALDTPVPYSPPLEAAFLPGEARTLEAARRLAAY